MNPKQVLIGAPVALLLLSAIPAKAEQTIDEVAAMACINDKWDETELEKDHKTVDFAGRCINVPDDPAEAKSAGDCVGKYEFMADGSWKGSGTCTYSYKDGGTLSDAWEEGSHLKDYTYKYTGGTGKFEGATGGGTYMYENITDTLAGGRYKGQLVLP
jgi:hypothetical protein